MSQTPTWSKRDRQSCRHWNGAGHCVSWAFVLICWLKVIFVSTFELHFTYRVNCSSYGWFSFCYYQIFSQKVHRLSRDDLEALRRAFSIYDLNGDGQIDATELKSVMWRLGCKPSDAEVREMIRKVDFDSKFHSCMTKHVLRFWYLKLSWIYRANGSKEAECGNRFTSAHCIPVFWSKWRWIYFTRWTKVCDKFSMNFLFVLLNHHCPLLPKNFTDHKFVIKEDRNYQGFYHYFLL